MEPVLFMSPIQRDDNVIEIVVIRRDSTDTGIRLLFSPWGRNIQMHIAKQKGVEVIIGDGVEIPEVYQNHVVLLSQAMVDAVRKLTDDHNEQCEGGCGMWFAKGVLDSDGFCPACASEDEHE